MARFTIIPTLGLRQDVPANDLELFRMIDETTAYTHCVDAQNVDHSKVRNQCSKSLGYTAWSNSATSSPARTHALFELDDGVNIDNLIFEKGRVFYYDGTPDPQQLNNSYIDYDNLAGGSFAVGNTITGGTAGTTATVVHVVEAASAGTLYLKDLTGGDGGFDDDEQLSNGSGVTADANGADTSTTWNNADNQHYDVIRYGSYMIMADWAGHTPQKWANGDNNLTSLITKSGATLYKFRFLVEWQRRIIGAYSNQTNGDLEIRWTDALPTWTDLEFAAANQEYKPGTDSINGFGKLGADILLLYGTDSISKINYFPDLTAVFRITPLVSDEGTAACKSIVSAQGANWFFNKNYGFVRYVGGSHIMSQDVISNAIEDIIADIDSRYYQAIVGKYVPLQQKIIWLIPQGAATTPSHMVSFDLKTGSWDKDVKAFRMADVWTRSAGEPRKLVLSNADGHVYSESGNDAATGNIDGYRTEPIISFGAPQYKSTLREIWFSITEGGNYSIDVNYRGGDTVKELEAASFASIGSVSLNNPEFAALQNFTKTNRYHQIKWGTNLKDEYFGVNRIDFIYEPEAY